MDLLELLSDEPGYFTRSQAHDVGCDDKTIASSVRCGAWTRFRRGYYCLTASWRAYDDVRRHTIRCRAVADSLGDSVAFSHVSASVLHGQDIWGQRLDRVHVTRLDKGAGRAEGDVVHHVGRAMDEQVMDLDGLLVVKPVRAAIETASRAGNEAALCHLDSLLRAGLGDERELLDQFHAMERWPFTRHLHVPVRLASHRSGSVGESRGMWMFFRHGLPRPIQQYEVRDSTGRIVATCDWGWPELGLLGEFDGRVKYGRLLQPGQEPGDAVFKEKQREDLVREVTGMRMIRLTWIDYDVADATVRRLRDAMHRAA